MRKIMPVSPKEQPPSRVFQQYDPQQTSCRSYKAPNVAQTLSKNLSTSDEPSLGLSC